MVHHRFANAMQVTGWRTWRQSEEYPRTIVGSKETLYPSTLPKVYGPPIKS